MLKRNSARSGNLATRILWPLLALGLIVGVMMVTLPEQNASKTTNTDKVAKLDDKASRCESQLADLIEAMSPGRLGISSDRAQVIDRLNAWRTECGTITGDVRPSNDRELLEKLLSGDSLNQALSDRFIAEDASHIRMSLLARDIVLSLVEGNPSNTVRTTKLFDFVCRTVMLVNQEIRDTTEMTPFESLLFGLGTAEDRAWIFSDLMRQLHTDVIILTPRGEGKAEHWLVGVIDPQAGIWLFDSRLGLPIPAADSPEDTPYPTVPATLREVLESDAPFRKLDVPDSPYPLTSADMKDLNVSLIGTSSSWAPRMALLQFLLPQGISVDLYDGLGANELRSPGLQERVISAGKDGFWKPEDVSLWPVPEQLEARFESTRGAGAEGSQLANFHIIFRGPYVPRQTGADGKSFEPTPIDKSLHYVRVEQLKGKYSDAIRDYLPIRTTVSAVPSPANETAAEFGTLWTGVCQFRTQKIRTAIGTLDRYVTTQSRSLGMTRSAVEYLADCMLAQKNFELAAQVLEKVPQGFAPRRDLYLARRWKKIAGIDPDKPAAAPAEKPGDEKPAAEEMKKPTVEEPVKPGMETYSAPKEPEKNPETPEKAEKSPPADEEKEKPASEKPEAEPKSPEPQPESKPEAPASETPADDAPPAEEKPAAE